MNISQALRKIRVLKGLKQKELAEALEISASHLSEAESGKANISLALLEKFCNYFGYKMFCVVAFSEWLQTKDERAYKLVAMFSSELKSMMDLVGEIDQ